ncbi:MAG TPA: type II secretion system minor pseudopilin GspK [Gammaproteobacteria bacterium]
MSQTASDRRQRGIALITALVVVAIATGMAAAIIWRTGLDTRRTATLVQGDQAMEYALGAEAWAEQILARDGRKHPNVTALDQTWAQQLPPLPVDGGQIQGKIEDLQGRFNINNVTTPAGAAQFGRLLTALGQDPTLAAAVAQWMTTNGANTGGDATDDYYSRLQPAYLTGQMNMQSISELLLVKGFTPAVYAQVSPYLCALPVSAGGGAGAGSLVNLNTASGPVMETLSQDMTVDVVSQVIGERGSRELSQTSPPQAISAFKLTGQTYDSNYFLVTVTAQIGTTHVTLYSLLYRNNNEVTAIRRTFGTL